MDDTALRSDNIAVVTSYASKSLAEKLGIRSGMRVIIMHAPKGYLDLLPDIENNCEVVSRLTGRFDFVQYFGSSPEQLGAVLPNLASHLKATGMLWVSWAKRTSRLHAGLDDSGVRSLGLGAGLVDVKVVSINEDWSSLKFVFRASDR